MTAPRPEIDKMVGSAVAAQDVDEMRCAALPELAGFFQLDSASFFLVENVRFVRSCDLNIGSMLIPTKAVTDYDLIPVSDSNAMPVTIGAKRRDAGETIVLEVTGIRQRECGFSFIFCFPFRGG